MSSTLILLRYDIAAAHHWITEKLVKLDQHLPTTNDAERDFGERSGDIEDIIKESKTFLTNHSNHDPVLQLSLNKLIKSYQLLNQTLNNNNVVVEPLRLFHDTDTDSISSHSSDATYTSRFDLTDFPVSPRSRKYIPHLTPLYRAVIRAKVRHHKRSSGTTTPSSLSVSPANSAHGGSPVVSPGRSAYHSEVTARTTTTTTTVTSRLEVTLDLSDSESELERFPWVYVSDDEYSLPEIQRRSPLYQSHNDSKHKELRNVMTVDEPDIRSADETVDKTDSDDILQRNDESLNNTPHSLPFKQYSQNGSKSGDKKTRTKSNQRSKQQPKVLIPGTKLKYTNIQEITATYLPITKATVKKCKVLKHYVVQPQCPAITSVQESHVEVLTTQSYYYSESVHSVKPNVSKCLNYSVLNHAEVNVTKSILSRFVRKFHLKSAFTESEQTPLNLDRKKVVHSKGLIVTSCELEPEIFPPSHDIREDVDETQHTSLQTQIQALSLHKVLSDSETLICDSTVTPREDVRPEIENLDFHAVQISSVMTHEHDSPVNKVRKVIGIKIKKSRFEQKTVKTLTVSKIHICDFVDRPSEECEVEDKEFNTTADEYKPDEDEFNGDGTETASSRPNILPNKESRRETLAICGKDAGVLLGEEMGTNFDTDIDTRGQMLNPILKIRKDVSKCDSAQEWEDMEIGNRPMTKHSNILKDESQDFRDGEILVIPEIRDGELKDGKEFHDISDKKDEKKESRLKKVIEINDPFAVSHTSVFKTEKRSRTAVAITSKVLERCETETTTKKSADVGSKELSIDCREHEPVGDPVFEKANHKSEDKLRRSHKPSAYSEEDKSEKTLRKRFTVSDLKTLSVTASETYDTPNCSGISNQADIAHPENDEDFVTSTLSCHTKRIKLTTTEVVEIPEVLDVSNTSNQKQAGVDKETYRSWTKLLLIGLLIAAICFLIAAVILPPGCENHCYHCGIFGLRKRFTSVPPH